MPTVDDQDAPPAAKGAEFVGATADFFVRMGLSQTQAAALRMAEALLAKLQVLGIELRHET